MPKSNQKAAKNKAAMTIWWCDVHQAESKGAFEGQPHTQCWRAWTMHVDVGHCRLVEYVAVPV